MTTNIGSLALQSKRPREYGDDGTTTRAGKWAAACGGINLRDPVRSIRRHRQARTRVIVLIVCVGVLLAGIVRMVWGMW